MRSPDILFVKINSNFSNADCEWGTNRQTLLKPEHIYIARIIDNDKYGGRLIADIFYKNKDGAYCSVSDTMLTNKFALPYNGKSKANEQEWMSFVAGANANNQ